RGGVGRDGQGVGGVQGQGGVDVGFELRQLPDHAACRNVEGGNSHRAEPRLLGWRRRADHLRGGTRGAQRHPCGDRQTGAPAAVEERQAGLSFARKRHPRPSPGVIFLEKRGSSTSPHFRRLRLPSTGGPPKIRVSDDATAISAQSYWPKPSCPKPCSTRSGRPIWWGGAPMAGISSISTGTCCTNCTRPTPSSNWKSSTGACAGRI